MKLVRCDHCPKEVDERTLYTVLGDIRLCRQCYEADFQRARRNQEDNQPSRDYRKERGEKRAK